MIEDRRKFIYRIDGEDQIVFANQAWYDFATENGTAGLTERSILRRPLWSFVADAGTRAILHMVISKVRHTGKPIRLPYRCDDPAIRRFMEVEIRPLPNAYVEFDSRIVLQEKREPVRLWSPETQRTDELIVSCSWCKKIQVESSHWMEVEDCIIAHEMFTAPRLPRVTHGVCPACRDTIEQDIDSDLSF